MRKSAGRAVAVLVVLTCAVTWPGTVRAVDRHSGMVPAQPAAGAAIGTIRIPALGVSQTIRSGMTDRQFDRGVGWWPGTALPGEDGNMVLAGHRTLRPRPFWDIQKLRAGDEILVTRRGAVHRYVVDRTKVVRNDATWILDQTVEARLTIFTCHPRGSTRQRYVVTAELAP